MNKPIHKIYPDGRQYWYLNGEYHRADGPAIISSNGSQEWLLNGKYHREDGPAYITIDGRQYWYRNGKRHREDGPALIYPEGTQYWYLDNTRIYSMKEYQEQLNLSDEDMIALILKYGNIE